MNTWLQDFHLIARKSRRETDSECSDDDLPLAALQNKFRKSRTGNLKKSERRSSNIIADDDVDSDAALPSSDDGDADNDADVSPSESSSSGCLDEAGDAETGLESNLKPPDSTNVEKPDETDDLNSSSGQQLPLAKVNLEHKHSPFEGLLIFNTNTNI